MSLFPLPSRGEPASPGLLATHDSLPSRSSQFRPTLATAFSSLRLSLPLAAILLTAASARAAAAADAASTSDEIVKLDKVTVVEKNGGFSALNYTESSRALRQIAGATSLVNNADVERGRASNAEDVLSFQPGVFAQATSGNVANKISIRGSGLNTFYQGYSLGTKYLYDGVSITGPGGTQEDLLNIAGVSYTEVLNGANAFTYASTSLGGAINFVTHTGYTSPGYYGRFEFGSFGYNKQQVSYGGVSGKADVYVTALHDKRTGFQDGTPNEGKDLIANFGYKISPRLETRLIVRYRELELQNGSTLTKAQIENDPRHNNILSGRKEPGTTLVTSTTSYRFVDDSTLELSLGYHDYPLHNGWKYSTTPQDWVSEDVTATLRYVRTDELFSRKASKTTFVFSDTRLVNGYVHGYNGVDGSVQTLRQYTQYSGSQDLVFALGNELELIARKLWLSTGLSLIDIDRDVRIERTVLPNPTAFPLAVSYNDWSLAPRAGLLFEVAPDIRLFGNVSRSIDGPVTWQMGSTGTGYVRPLRPQKANTVEIGVRGSAGIFEGSLAVYRSWIRDELLTVIVIPATPTSDAITANSNATPTIHQGIEAGLTTRLWAARGGDRLILRQAYTLNDFYYRNDALFGDNQLPSLPRQVYQAELVFQQAKGFYAGVNLRAASSYFVDYANTLSAPGYAIYGAKLGYETPRWQVFVDLRNLSDKHYATTANTAYNLHGVDSANFYPGDGFSVISGISLRF